LATSSFVGYGRIGTGRPAACIGIFLIRLRKPVPLPVKFLRKGQTLRDCLKRSSLKGMLQTSLYGCSRPFLTEEAREKYSMAAAYAPYSHRERAGERGIDKRSVQWTLHSAAGRLCVPTRRMGTRRSPGMGFCDILAGAEGLLAVASLDRVRANRTMRHGLSF